MPAPNSPVRDQLQKDITAAVKAAGAGDVRVTITTRGRMPVMRMRPQT